MSVPTIFIHDLASAISPAGKGPQRGMEFGKLTVHSPASIALSGERILAVGPPREVLRDFPPQKSTRMIDGRGKSAVPGLVDCHTHAAFLGSRADEFELRCRGASYEEIQASGGGILSTVEATRNGTRQELGAALERHLDWMLYHGTTTAEVKSGYGLDRETELTMLRAILEVDRRHPVDLHPTFLGAHTVPYGFESAKGYIEFVIREVLPEAAALARAADIFVERGSFEVPEARRYLAACRERGLVLRVHADQFSERGALPLALEMGARSADHLESTSEEGARLLAGSDTAAVLLPACGLFLGLPNPPVKQLVEGGAIIALATDLNPGSSFCSSLPIVMNLGCTRLGLTPSQVLAACTVNAAYVLGLHQQIGRLAPGYRADILLLDDPDWRYLVYHLGGDHIAARVKSGRTVDPIRW